MIEYLKYAGIMFALIIMQKTFIELIDVTDYNITPDIVLIGVVYIGIKRGKITGSVGGFISGLVIDIFSFSFLGLMALSKSIAGFLSGFFHNQTKMERYLGSYAFILIVSFCSLVNNFIYYLIYFQGSNLQFADILLRYVIPTTVYTALFSIFPVLFSKRRRFSR
ncbi:MAG: rod shape-determining protein MreD [Ignavibacteria bacterium]|nr:rod shape-determining protein MreD [Ignavibacteria bacterium]